MGLQTPGEVVDANFGQEPFVFDIEDMMKELRSRTRMSIFDFPVPESQGEWQAILNKLVFIYVLCFQAAFWVICVVAELLHTVPNLGL